jgi:hypothetical protein
MHVGLGEIFTQGKRDGWTLKKKKPALVFLLQRNCTLFTSILVSNPSVSDLGIKRESGAIPELSPQL